MAIAKSLKMVLRILALAICLLASDLVRSQGAPRNDDGTFRNNYPHATTDFGDFIRWQFERTAGREPEGGWRIPALPIDLPALRAPSANPSVTWIGHATVLLRLAGKNILIDPNFSERASPVPFAGPKRIVPVPVDVPDLPPVDVVLISHNHYDHLDEPSVRRLAAMARPGPRFLVPLGLKAWFADIGIERVEEMDWWQSVREGDATVTFVPVQHWSRRGLFDRDATLWGGWSIAGDGLRVIHLGDTGYSADFRNIGERLGPFDLALIPIGAYAPRWFMEAKHLDVAEAVQVRADLRARRAIGIHWGTFPMGDDPPDEAPRLLMQERERAGLARDDFDVLSIGETRSLR
jgi:L-ascorbate metabolism protein UlaG (beta-lactamase superfamily)